MPRLISGALNSLFRVRVARPRQLTDKLLYLLCSLRQIRQLIVGQREGEQRAVLRHVRAPTGDHVALQVEAHDRCGCTGDSWGQTCEG